MMSSGCPGQTAEPLEMALSRVQTRKQQVDQGLQEPNLSNLVTGAGSGQSCSNTRAAEDRATMCPDTSLPARTQLQTLS